MIRKYTVLSLVWDCEGVPRIGTHNHQLHMCHGGERKSLHFCVSLHSILGGARVGEDEDDT